MFGVTERQRQLPDNIEELSKFVLVGREKLTAVRAEIRAINKVGLSISTISQYRSGYAMPGIEKAVAIARAFGVDPAWLLGLDVLMEELG